MDNYTQQAADLLAQMTLEEKIDLTIGKDSWSTYGVPRLGIPSINVADGPHGLRKAVARDLTDGLRSLPATCFPTASALACSWDPSLVEEVGRAIAEECQAQDVQVLLGPGVNLKRTPLCGRNFEYYSEDPLLAGEMGCGFVRGVQSRGVGTSLKHFACNNQEWERMSISAEVDERTLRELYLSAFERIVKQADPWTVMCSYNRLNGIPAAEHRGLLTAILKDEWRYEGVVVSDWGAVDNKPASLAAGLDLEMPGPGLNHTTRIAALVQSGALSEMVIDAAALRMLRLILRANAARKTGIAFDVAAHHALARRVAAESIVLLKNTDGLLPLVPAALRSVAVIGGFARDPRYQGSGSSRVTSTRVDSPYDELARSLGDGVTLGYAAGYSTDGTLSEAGLAEALAIARSADAAIVIAGLPESYEAEGMDRNSLALPQGHDRLIAEVCRVQPRTVVVLQNGSAVTMPWFDAPAAILEAGLGGQAVGGAVAEVLLGVVNPCGRLAETLPMRLEDTPAFLNYPGESGSVRYGEGLFIGYRYYDKKGISPRLPFGYGLSYTSFRYSGLHTDRTTLRAGETLQIDVTVRNSGARAGKEVVQLYVHMPVSQYNRPTKELVAFAKVHLQPGESRVVSLQLAARDLMVYDTERHAFRLEGATCRLLVAGTDLSAEITLVEDPGSARRVFTRYTSLKQFFLDPEARMVLLETLQTMPFAGADMPDTEREMMFAIPICKLVNFGRLAPEALEALLEKVNRPG
ncbi:MAG: glycoside hydrolase family 3 C-terminal domain-containing protein [Anaerolineae bacterium]